MAEFVIALVTAGGISLSSRLSILPRQARKEARTSLFLVNGNDDFSDELASLAGDNGTFDLEIDNLSATLESAGALTGVTGFGDDLPFRPVTSLGGGCFMAFVTNDPILLSNGYGGLGDSWTDCEAMHEFVETMRDIADVMRCNAPVCATTSECVLPQTRFTNVIFVDGDYEILPPGGSGTLVVTGEIRYDGRASWNGMIYAFMVAGIAGPDGVYGNEDDCTGGDENGLGEAKFDMSGGGTGDTQYCSADILAAKPNPPWRITSFRQH